MLTAIVYTTNNKGEQVETCRLQTVDGKITPSTLNSSGLYVLGRFLTDPETGRKVTKEDGDTFLRMLPSAYSGSRLRVGLIES